MSPMQCPTCPRPKPVGFLIVSEGGPCNGIPKEFSRDTSVNASSGTVWEVTKANKDDALRSGDALPILWKITEAGKTREIFHGKEREAEGWRKEDFLWFTVDANMVDLRLFDDILRYIDMNKTSPDAQD